MNPKLLELGVKQTIGKGCKCSSSKLVYSYNLPFGLDVSIVDHLAQMGKPSTTFEKHAILKIETANFSITGMKKSKQIKFVLKKDDTNSILDLFETALIQWLEAHKT